VSRHDVTVARRFYRATQTRVATMDVWRTPFAALRRDQILADAEADPRYAIGQHFQPAQDSLLHDRLTRPARLAAIKRQRAIAARRAEIAVLIEARNERVRNGTGSLFDRVDYALDQRHQLDHESL
jgi:hypothetical protein